MGLSSSQARLLHLTSRMHQIEYKAAKTQAEKLQMANHTARVRQEYLDALEETRIQYGRLTSDGSVEFRNASANILQNGSVPGYEGEHASSPLFLQAQNGEIWVTPRVATEFGIEGRAETMGLDEYLISCGDQMTELTHTEYVPGDQVIGLTVVPTTVHSQYSENTTYTFEGFGDLQRNITPAANVNYTQFQEGATYKISSAADMSRLSYLANHGYNVANINIELGANIDMSQVEDWTPFAVNNITFNGAGHTISNMTTPLFTTMTSSTVKDVKLKSTTAGISGSNVGFVAQTTNGTSSSHSVIRNVVINGSMQEVNGKISDNTSTGIAGMFVGTNIGYLDVQNFDAAEINLNSTQATGGVVGKNTGTLNISQGHVKGHFNGASEGTGGCVGVNSGGTVNITNFGYATTTDSNITSEDNLYIGNQSAITGINAPDGSLTGLAQAHAHATETLSLNTVGQEYNTYDVQIPKILADGTGTFYSNIYGVLTKRSGSLPDDNMTNKIKAYLISCSSTEDGRKELYWLNENISKYFAGELGANFANALYNDINNTQVSPPNASTTATSNGNFRSGSKTLSSVSYRVNNSTWEPTAHYAANGVVTIPDKENIKEGIKFAFQKAGYTGLDSKINQFMNLYDTNNLNDKGYLARINDIVKNYATSGSTTDLETLRDYISGPTRMTEFPSYIGENISHYTINVADYNEHGVQPQYNMEPVQVSDGFGWDTSNQTIALHMAMWALAQRGCQILEPEQAESEEYLTNSINAGEYVLTTFDPSNVDSLLNLTQQQIEEMSDSQYNELMGIVNTSVAVETNLQEVQDETLLRIAEAKYEADMRKIDKKERKYDAELATYDNERNAIKQEIETLKTVARENVDRTFKLFS